MALATEWPRVSCDVQVKVAANEVHHRNRRDQSSHHRKNKQAGAISDRQVHGLVRCRNSDWECVQAVPKPVDSFSKPKRYQNL